MFGFRKETPSWEVIPSISLEAGKAVIEEWGPNTVIDIDVTAAETALKALQDRKAKPGIVHFSVEKHAPQEKNNKPDFWTLGYAFRNGDKSSTVLVGIYCETSSKQGLLAPERIQKTAIHELQHAADFTVRGLRRREEAHFRKASFIFQRKAMFASLVGNAINMQTLQQGAEPMPIGSILFDVAKREFHETVRENSLFERRAEATDGLAHDTIITVSPSDPSSVL